MQRKALVIVGLFLALAASVEAKDYESPFGFKVRLPDYWTIVSRGELKENPDLVERMYASEVFRTADKAFLQKIFKSVKSGQTEFYINKKTSTKSFADNISVQKDWGRIPTSDAQIQQLRQQLKVLMKAKLGKQVKIYRCELKTVGGKSVLLTEMGGLQPRARYVGYQVQKSPNVYLTIGLTTQNSTLDTNRKELERIVESLEFSSPK